MEGDEERTEQEQKGWVGLQLGQDSLFNWAVVAAV